MNIVKNMPSLENVECHKEQEISMFLNVDSYAGPQNDIVGRKVRRVNKMIGQNFSN